MIKINIYIFSFLFTVFLIIGGCSESSRIGPSDQKVRLDFNDVINKQFHSVVQLKSFKVDDFHQLSEDRVDIDVTMALQIKPDIEREINNYQDPLSRYSSHPLKPYLRKASRFNMGHDEYITMHYKLNDRALWIAQGFSPRKL